MAASAELPCVGAVVGELRAHLAGVPREELRRAFDRYDGGGGGELDAFELRLALDSLGFAVSARDLGPVVDFFDSDGNGTVSFDEMVAFAAAGFELRPAANPGMVQPPELFVGVPTGAVDRRAARR